MLKCAITCGVRYRVSICILYNEYCSDNTRNKFYKYPEGVLLQKSIVLCILAVHERRYIECSGVSKENGLVC